MTLNILALRVPCDARMSRRDAELAALRQTHPETPAHPVLFGEPEREGKVKIEDEGPKSKDQRKINFLSSFRHSLV